MSYFAMFAAVLVAVYTVIFGIDIWGKKNHAGAVAIFILALGTLALPLYALFFRG